MDFLALAQNCAPMVAPNTMLAIVRTESSFKPFAIGINRGSRLAWQPGTREEAIATAKWLIARGYSIDMGLGQINSANLPRLGITIEDAFDPCKNLAASGRLLQANYINAKKAGYGEHQALYAAISAYNTGSFTRGFTNGYVQKAINNTSHITIRVTSSQIPIKAPEEGVPRTSNEFPQAKNVMVYQ